MHQLFTLASHVCHWHLTKSRIDIQAVNFYSFYLYRTALKKAFGHMDSRGVLRFLAGAMAGLLLQPDISQTHCLCAANRCELNTVPKPEILTCRLAGVSLAMHRLAQSLADSCNCCRLYRNLDMFSTGRHPYTNAQL